MSLMEVPTDVLYVGRSRRNTRKLPGIEHRRARGPLVGACRLLDKHSDQGVIVAGSYVYVDISRIRRTGTLPRMDNYARVSGRESHSWTLWP